MQSYKGFQAKQRGECLYQEVMSAYEEYTKTGESGDLEKLESYVAEGSIGSSTNPHIFPKDPISNEEEVVSYLNRVSNRNFKLVEDEYCRYDAEDGEYILEIKVRNKWYQDCLIEYDKFDDNISTSSSLGKDFLYVVATSQDIYVFNCTKLHKKGFKFKWDWKIMPKNTDFGGSEQKVTKFVGYIPVSEASVHYKN
jgi:hypothetical protein